MSGKLWPLPDSVQSPRLLTMRKSADAKKSVEAKVHLRSHKSKCIALQAPSFLFTLTISLEM